MDVAAALGWLGFVFAIAGTQCRTKLTMFAMDGACSISNALHFYYSDALGGAYSQVIFLYVSMLGVAIAARPSLGSLFFTAYPVIVLFGYQAYSAGGLLELLPQTKVLTAVIGKQVDSMLMTRVLILLSCAPSLLYGYIVGSMPYLTSSTIFTVFSVIAVYKELRGTLSTKPSMSQDGLSQESKDILDAAKRMDASVPAMDGDDDPIQSNDAWAAAKQKQKSRASPASVRERATSAKHRFGERDADKNASGTESERASNPPKAARTQTPTGNNLKKKD